MRNEESTLSLLHTLSLAYLGEMAGERWRTGRDWLLLLRGIQAWRLTRSVGMLDGEERGKRVQGLLPGQRMFDEWRNEFEENGEGQNASDPSEKG